MQEFDVEITDDANPGIQIKGVSGYNAEVTEDKELKVTGTFETEVDDLLVKSLLCKILKELRMIRVHLEYVTDLDEEDVDVLDEEVI